MERYVEYHVVDGKIVELTPDSDWKRHPEGYPYDIFQKVRGWVAEWAVESPTDRTKVVGTLKG